MNQWTIKNFYKNKAVILVIHYPNHRVKEYWALPNKGEQNTASVLKDQTRYNIDTETQYFAIRNGVPVFTYKHNEINPINILQESLSPYPAHEFETAMLNKVVPEIHKASSGKPTIDWAMISAFVGIAVLLAVVYYNMR